MFWKIINFLSVELILNGVNYCLLSSHNIRFSKHWAVHIPESDSLLFMYKSVLIKSIIAGLLGNPSLMKHCYVSVMFVLNVGELRATSQWRIGILSPDHWESCPLFSFESFFFSLANLGEQSSCASSQLSTRMMQRPGKQDESSGRLVGGRQLRQSWRSHETGHSTTKYLHLLLTMSRCFNLKMLSGCFF